MKRSAERPLSSKKTMTEIDPARSNTMRAVRSKDTGPEVVVLRLAHHLGYRFKLHRKDLPSTPDLVFPKYRAVIFVYGCFWHGHNCARGSRAPKRTPNTGCESWNETKRAMPKPRQICCRPDGGCKRFGNAG